MGFLQLGRTGARLQALPNRRYNRVYSDIAVFAVGFTLSYILNGNRHYRIL